MNILKIFLSISALITMNGGLGYAQSSPSTTSQLPVSITVYQENKSNGVEYHYQVKNNGNNKIVRFEVGINEWQNTYVLKEYPVGWTVEHPERSNIKSPPGWSGKVGLQEETDDHIILWTAESEDKYISPGQILSDFSVLVSKADSNFLDAEFRVGLFGTFPYVGRLKIETNTPIPVDNTPPAIELSSSASRIWPPNNKMVPITINLKVTDDKDPAPKIKLVSITCNEGCIQDRDFVAEIGKDTRTFSLKATRSGKSKGRIYTIKYSATDAANNSTTKSLDILVPHNQ